jgi:hypothetical protein
MHLSDDIYPSRGALDATEGKLRPTPDHNDHKITNDMAWALNEAATSDNIKPAVSEILDGVTPPEKRIPCTLGDISREEFEELMGKTAASEIIDNAFEAAEKQRSTLNPTRLFPGTSLRLAPDQIVTLIRAEVEKLTDTIKDRSGHFRVERRHIEDRAREITTLVMALPESIEL